MAPSERESPLGPTHGMGPPPPVQLTRAGTIVGAGRDELSRLREQFERLNYIRLPGLIEGRQAEALADAIDRSEFVERIHPNAGTPPPIDWCLNNDKVSGELSFLANDRSVLAFVEDVTACQVGAFRGVVYRLEPGHGYDVWHDDVRDHRLIAMSINLGRQMYTGGVLQLREKGSSQILHELPNTGLGDAILFRVALNLEHRVSPLTGQTPRTALAGWFVSEPDFMTLVKRGAGVPA